MAMTVVARDSIEIIMKQMQQIEYRSQFLSRQLSELDGTVNDINHFIELEPLQVGQMTRLVYKLKKLLIARRKVKDELKLLREFKGILSIQPSRAKGWLALAETRLKEQQYTVRQKTLETLLEK